MQHYQLTDLHRHLDGSLRLETLRELALKKDWPVWDNIRFYKGISLQDALSKFNVTVCCMQSESALQRVASEACEDALADGVTTLELRFAPHLHMHAGLQQYYRHDTNPFSNDTRTLKDYILRPVLDGMAEHADKFEHLGLILCGLYGDHPETFEHFVDLATNEPRIVGIDLAGGPYDDMSWQLEDYEAPFTYAKDSGLGTTAHLGEGRDPAEVAKGIRLLELDRIGHASTVQADSALAHMIREREIVIETCATSNIQLGIYDSYKDHPITDWLKSGIPATVCTDNTMFSNVTSSQEHMALAMHCNWNAELIHASVEWGKKGAFRRRNNPWTKSLESIGASTT